VSTQTLPLPPPGAGVKSVAGEGLVVGFDLNKLLNGFDELADGEGDGAVGRALLAGFQTLSEAPLGLHIERMSLPCNLGYFRAEYAPAGCFALFVIRLGVFNAFLRRLMSRLPVHSTGTSLY
jgi:hypothetical protein